MTESNGHNGEEGKAYLGNPERLSERTGSRLVYFAAERTLLSWVRAALGLMIFGFVVDRFGLFLRESGN